MRNVGRILLLILTSSVLNVNAQFSTRNVFDYGLDRKVKNIEEVTCQFNFDSRKCEELKKTIIYFSDDGQIISEEVFKGNRSIGQTKYLYDSMGRVTEIQSDTRKVFNYIQAGDTLKVNESSENTSVEYRYIYDDDELQRLSIFKDGTLVINEIFQYSGGKLSGKKVQHFGSDGEEGVYEVHRYKNGKTVYFSKRNSESDDKSCHYYFNARDGSLDFEETARPGMDAVISKDCNYIYEKDYWIGKSEEIFSVPLSASKLSSKQKHLFYFRRIILKDGTKIGTIRVRNDFIDRYIE
jgi:hypothetical protein